MIMKKILLFLVGVAMSLSLTSCVTAVHAQDDIYSDGEVDATVVISYGTPYIVNGLIEYYAYRGWYYYPCWTGDSYYFHRYRRPLPPRAFHDWYRPIPRNHVYHRPHSSRPGYKPSAPQHRHNPYHRRDVYRKRDMNRGPQMSRPNRNMGGRPSGSHRSNIRMGGRR
jgi:predicted small secreted protein